jgi:hypothetical protein
MMTLVQLRPLRRAYTLRSVIMWLGVRVALAFGSVTDPELATEVCLLPIVALAVVLDARRRGEDIFLGNLGIPAWSIALVALPIATLLELLVP